MDIIDIIATLITFSAVSSYFNYQYFHLPRTIGLVLSALILSSGLIVAGQLGWDVKDQAITIARSIDFNRVLLNGMLSFMLFAGALNVELNELINQKWVVFSLATGGGNPLYHHGGWFCLGSVRCTQVSHPFCVLSALRRADLSNRSGGRHQYPEDNACTEEPVNPNGR
jgi:hypothetical protein